MLLNHVPAVSLVTSVVLVLLMNTSKWASMELHHRVTSPGSKCLCFAACSLCINLLVPLKLVTSTSSSRSGHFTAHIAHNHSSLRAVYTTPAGARMPSHFCSVTFQQSQKQVLSSSSYVVVSSISMCCNGGSSIHSFGQ